MGSTMKNRFCNKFRWLSNVKEWMIYDNAQQQPSKVQGLFIIDTKQGNKEIMLSLPWHVTAKAWSIKAHKT